MPNTSEQTKTILITGSTRGIGYGLAQAFLGRGCRVVISGRTQQSVRFACEQLAGSFDPRQLFSVVCDVGDCAQVQALWNAAWVHFGQIDVWINNAGLSHARAGLWELPAETMNAVVRTNLVGVMYGARVALTGMLAQGHGAVYNMEGLGSDGRRVPGLALYGTTKNALRYLTRALADEVKNTAVIVGALSPGMVLTDLLLHDYREDPERLAREKRIFNILADRVETVAPWLAEQVLANRVNGAHIRWLTGSKILLRFLNALFNRRDLFAGYDLSTDK